ncbi:hypothetical protein BPOR_0086g00090 [Botrytis porri]|uniref:2EXR domain-containing protein n=1 Tax=Botrytis porri TaxID=87229 RepID=A0A4Z1KZH9_9HELO|nr:hypothetical protein BPOR_0086g00090 [Botrytis porri]
MIPLEEETADEEVQYLINPPLPQIYDSTEDTKTFHKFNDLPIELQLKIFKRAMPAARVIRWTRKVDWHLSENRYPMFNLRSFPGLFSLLNTCSVSNKSVHHDGGFVRIKWIYGKGSTPAYLTKWVQKHHTFVHYNYLRPNHHVFLLDYDDLIEADLIGGSINLQSFTHLALYGNHMRPQGSILGKLLEFIQTHCPNIKRDTKTKSRSQDVFETRSLMDTASEFMFEVDAVYQEMDRKSMAFWKNVQAVPVLDCGSQNPFDEFELYIPHLEAYACSNNDETLQTTTSTMSKILNEPGTSDSGGSNLYDESSSEDNEEVGGLPTGTSAAESHGDEDFMASDDELVSESISDSMASDDESVSESISAPEAPQSNSSDPTNPADAATLTEFHPFSRFSLELQIMVFELALPVSDPVSDPLLLKFEIDIQENPTEIRRNKKTGEASYQAVLNGGYERIAISSPDNNNRQDNYVLQQKPHLNIKYLVVEPTQRDHTWLRPAKDTLVVYAKEIVMLYQHGGSMNLENITHLAVHNLVERDRHNGSKVRARNLWKWVFLIAEKHCPALKKLSLLLGIDFTEEADELSEIELDTHHIIVDVDENFYQLDFHDESYDERSVAYGERFGIDELFTKEKLVVELRDTSTVLAEYLDEHVDDESKAKYWEKVEVLPGFRARPDHQANTTKIMGVGAWVPHDANGKLTLRA